VRKRRARSEQMIDRCPGWLLAGKDMINIHHRRSRLEGSLAYLADVSRQQSGYGGGLSHDHVDAYSDGQRAKHPSRTVTAMS
jgi:hypothetical protein